MKLVFARLATVARALSLSSAASAQAVDAALSEARARVACGADVLVSAVFLPGGGVQVTCSRAPTTETAQAIAEGTGLGSQAAVGVVAGAGVLAVITGSGSSGTTTTTTTQP